ncbi:MAG: LemA family protein [Erysipelotrichales bacterium]|nr:LemA family protein [Erysipelotrichales bacterium]
MLNIVLVIIVVIILFLVVSYNNMVKLSNKVEEGYSSIDVALMKRYDLITNLTEVVKGYTKYESEILEKIVKERNMTNKDQMMDEVQSNILALAEAYPTLKADVQYRTLMEAMSECEEHLQAARRFYNSNVSAYNTCIQQLPCSLFANSFGFTNKEFYRYEGE